MNVFFSNGALYVAEIGRARTLYTYCVMCNSMGYIDSHQTRRTRKLMAYIRYYEWKPDIQGCHIFQVSRKLLNVVYVDRCI